MMTSHDFKTSIEGVELSVVGNFYPDGKYEIDTIHIGENDVTELLADHVNYIVQNRAVETLTKEMNELEDN